MSIHRPVVFVSLVFLAVVLGSASSRADLINGIDHRQKIYVRPGTDVRIVIELEVPLSDSQLEFLDSELNLIPGVHLAGLEEIRFVILELPPNVSIPSVTKNRIFIQAPVSDNRGLFNTVRTAVGARLFLTLPEDEKRQIDDLFQAPLHRLDDDLLARTFGTLYSDWSEHSERFLRSDLQTLIDAARTGQGLPLNRGLGRLDTLLTLGSFYATPGMIPFYETPSDNHHPVSGKAISQALSSSASILRLGDYELLVEDNQIVGVVDFNEGPTHGEKVYFKNAVSLPALTWKNFAENTPKDSIVTAPAEPAAPIIPHSSNRKKGPAQFVGPSPDTYLPVFSPKGIKLLDLEAGPHPVTRVK